MLQYSLFSQQIKGKKDLSSYIAEGHQLIDIRTPTEHQGNTAKNSISIPLAEIYQHLDKLDKSDVLILKL